jgi:hypothetical protein
LPRFKICRFAAAGALALIVIVPMAACGAPGVSPLPVDAGETAPIIAADPTPSASPADSSRPGVAKPATVRKPTKTKPSKPTATSSPDDCRRGRRDLDLQNTVLDLNRWMCFYTGGVLRLQGIGPPDLATWEPAELVVSSYAGGVQDLAFVRPGTATVTIPQEGQNHTVTVVVRS